jgi:hypothetical protein
MHVKITSGNVDTYPYNVGQLRRDNPNTSFPKQIPNDMLESYGVMPVTVADMPSINPRTQKVEQEATPSLVSGAWAIGWTISSKTAEETEDWDNSIASSNRDTRNQLLSDSDWTQLPDSALTDEAKALWVTYRSALRDLTAHENWPNLEDADWPTKP